MTGRSADKQSSVQKAFPAKLPSWFSESPAVCKVYGIPCSKSFSLPVIILDLFWYRRIQIWELAVMTGQV